ncbi:hypothetical protein [Pseudokineococcus sp. 1T1Z-3]|uniref:hypothetical protein n=1 Tax=Pseudokineococcus sp. 1T1Z-3 TaxID=3132745 RepID=UPI0030B649F1
MVTSRDQLLVRYRELVLDRLPRRGREEGWVVHLDHCVGRVVLDNAVGGAWRTLVPAGRGPAFTRLDDAQLGRAVDLAERMDAEGAALVADLDARSLTWRGKAPRRAPRPPAAGSGAGTVATSAPSAGAR